MPKSSSPTPSPSTETLSPTPPLSQPLSDAELSLLTSLDPHIEDCGNPKVDCPDQGCLIFDDCNGGYGHLFVTTCGRWTCPYCGTVKRAKLQARIREAQPNRFITLTTCGHETETPRQIFDWTRRQISELGKLIRRQGRTFEYLRCLEATKTGYPHYHLLVRSPYLDQRELSAHWCHFTRAYIVDIRSLTKDENAARYVMKYLTKQSAVPFTNRRLSWTRKFFPKEPTPPKAEFCPVNIKRYSGRPKDYFHWDGCHARWEQINRWHYITKEPIR